MRQLPLFDDETRNPGNRRIVSHQLCRVYMTKGDRYCGEPVVVALRFEGQEPESWGRRCEAHATFPGFAKGLAAGRLVLERVASATVNTDTEDR